MSKLTPRVVFTRALLIFAGCILLIPIAAYVINVVMLITLGVPIMERGGVAANSVAGVAIFGAISGSLTTLLSAAIDGVFDS